MSIIPERNLREGIVGDSIVYEVREAVVSIEPGHVASYGEIGAHIGAGSRQVGRAMTLLGRGPDRDAADRAGTAGAPLPWWRVVRADGTPSTCHGGRARARLLAEGTPMKGRRVDMDRARHRWPPA